MTTPVSLGDIATFIRGITFKPEDKIDQSSAGAVVCMRTKNVQDVLDQDDLIAIPASFVKRDEQYLAEGDILVSTANSWELVGKSCWVPKLEYPATAGGFISILRADRKKVNPRYLYHWMNSGETQHKLRYCGRQTTNISNMSFELACSLALPLPPLPEQKRIAAILDKADSIRRKRQEAVRLTEELLRSVFLDMFGDPVTNPKGWETLCMEEVILEGPQNGLYKHESDYGSGTLIVRIDSFYDGEVTGLDKLKRVRLDAGTIKKYQLREDDLLVNRVNSRKFLGKSAIVPALREPTVFESNMMRITVNKAIVCPHYLVSLLQHQYIKTQIDNKAKDAVNQSSINQDDVKTFELRIPPFELQARFVEIKKKTYRLLLQKIKAVEVENTLFNSLLQRTFRGEL